MSKIWLKCLQKAKIPHRLTLIYLANDIVQNAKRKNSTMFISAFRNVLKDTISYLRDEKIKKSVERVFSIWQDRNIFDTRFTAELKNSLNGIASSPKIEHQVNKNTTNDLISTLDRLTNLEQSRLQLEDQEDSIQDRSYITNLKIEIEERNKLAKLLVDLLDLQKRLLRESEEQLVKYKTQLEYITKPEFI